MTQKLTDLQKLLKFKGFVHGFFVTKQWILDPTQDLRIFKQDLRIYTADRDLEDLIQDLRI